MLQKLNERIQGIFAWIIIVLIAGAFASFGIDYYWQSRNTKQVEVTVNGQGIGKQEFELVMRRAQQANPDLLRGSSEQQLKQKLLHEMIMQNLALQSANTNGFAISPVQVDSTIMAIPQFQDNGHFSPQRFQYTLNNNLFTPETFQQEVHQGLLLNQQRFAFMGTEFALPSEIAQFVELFMQTRDYAYLEIKKQQFAPQVHLTDADIEAYYQKNKQSFMTPEKVIVEYVILSLQNIKNKIHPSEADIQQYYDENKTNYNIPAKWQVASILFANPTGKKTLQQEADDAYQQLKSNPNQFNTLVRERSDDKLSAAHGGELPWVSAGETEYDKYLAELTKPGEISPPIKTAAGYQIFKLLAYQPARLQPLATVQEQIKEQMINEKAQTQYNQDLDQLSEISYQNPDSLSPVAQALGLTVERSEPLGRNDNSPTGIGKDQKIVQAAFSPDVFKLGNNSEVIQYSNDSVIVLRVGKHIKPIQQQLAEVKATIVNKLTEQQVAAVIQALGEKLLHSDQQQSEKLMTSNNLQWHTIKGATREATNINQQVNNIAFAIGAEGELSGKAIDSGDFIIVNLKAVHKGKMSAVDKKQIAGIKRRLEASYGILDYDLYTNALLQKAKIVKH